MSSLLDGNIVDMFTVMTALGAVGLRCARCAWTRTTMQSDRLITDALNGATLAPFVTLILAAVSSTAFDALRGASMVAFSLAGLVGTIWVAKELAKP